MKNDFLAKVIEKLEMAFVPYMVVGSVAGSYYGISRSTIDIDIVISPDPAQLEHLTSLLKAEDFYLDPLFAQEALKNRSMFNLMDAQSKWKVDFIIQKYNLYHRKAFERRIQAKVQGVPLFISTVEDIVISKLDWSRLGGSLRQLEDVAGILKLQHTKMDAEYLKEWIYLLDLSKEWNETLKMAMISFPH